jgi:hypothetical protein
MTKKILTFTVFALLALSTASCQKLQARDNLNKDAQAFRAQSKRIDRFKRSIGLIWRTANFIWRPDTLNSLLPVLQQRKIRKSLIPVQTFQSLLKAQKRTAGRNCRWTEQRAVRQSSRAYIKNGG